MEYLPVLVSDLVKNLHDFEEAIDSQGGMISPETSVPARNYRGRSPHWGYAQLSNTIDPAGGPGGRSVVLTKR